MAPTTGFLRRLAQLGDRQQSCTTIQSRTRQQQSIRRYELNSYMTTSGSSPRSRATFGGGYRKPAVRRATMLGRKG